MPNEASALRMRPDVQLQAPDGKNVAIWIGRQAFQIDGVPPEFMRALVPLLDGRLDPAGIIRALAPAWTAGQTISALEALRSIGCVQPIDDHCLQTAATQARVIVVGDGRLAAACA